MAHEHDGRRSRMRERFLGHGLENFAPHEILEILLYYTVTRSDTNPLAHRLLAHFGSLHAVLEAEVESLCQVEGVSLGTATHLALVGAVQKPLALSKVGHRAQLANRESLKKYCVALLHGLKEEHFYVICLDSQLRCITAALIAKGTCNEVSAYPRVVAGLAIRHNAHAVVLCHNHPQGEALPSQADMDTTKQLSQLFALLHINLIDHVVVADENAFSIMRYGAL